MLVALVQLFVFFRLVVQGMAGDEFLDDVAQRVGIRHACTVILNASHRPVRLGPAVLEAGALFRKATGRSRR